MIFFLLLGAFKFPYTIFKFPYTILKSPYTILKNPYTIFSLPAASLSDGLYLLFCL